jgi:hypothetical protein
VSCKTAGPSLDRMLTPLHRPHQHVVAGRLGAPAQFRRLAGEQFVCAVEHRGRRQPGWSAASRLTRGSCQPTRVPSSHADRKSSSSGRDRILSRSASLVMVSLVSVTSTQGKSTRSHPAARHLHRAVPAPLAAKWGKGHSVDEMMSLW